MKQRQSLLPVVSACAFAMASTALAQSVNNITSSVSLNGVSIPGVADSNSSYSGGVGLLTNSMTKIFNGTASTYSSACSVTGAISNASCQLATASAPHSVNLLTPVVANAASTLLGKASPGNLYTAYVTTTATSWLYVFNSTTAPSAGAVTAGTASGNYQDCIEVGANTEGSIGGLDIPEYFSSGIYFALSSTACGTLTLATTGFIHGLVK